MMTGLLWNEPAFLLLVLLIQFLCLSEYFSLVEKIFPDLKNSHMIQRLTQVIGFAALTLFSLSTFDNDYYFKADLWPALLFFPALVLLLSTLFKGSLSPALNAFGGILYICLPLLLLLGLRSISIVIPLALILMIWMNDTMAYLVGSFFGKHSLTKISPKKTWEGTIGGIVLTIAGAAVWGYYSDYYRMKDWISLAIIVSVAGTAGDLLQSQIKRLAEVKDSGTLMPGHGGALDRFDSLLVVTPFAYAYAYLFMPALPLVIF
jgi:phosphatidate cytidylyltransferase